MHFDYGTQLSPVPIKLSIGTLKKPKLLEISELGFDKFNMFEAFLKMTPELFYTKIKGNEGKTYWESLSEQKQEDISLYSLILADESLQETYLSIFRFFFVEPVVFKEDMFILLNDDVENASELKADNVRGVIHEKIFLQTLDLIQQVCCIAEKEQSIDEMKFKNKTARKLYEKMLKAKKNERKKADINLSIPNIISSVSNKHPSINPINIWELTIFQLLDSFNRLQANTMYEIDCTRVSVWGDEKKTFDAALWYKNNYDTK